MKTHYIVFLFSFFFGSSAISQEGLIICNTEQNQDRTISIYADSRAFGEYTVKLIFTNLAGYRSYAITNDMALVTVTHGKREILKLTPDKTAPIFSFSYRYQYLPGIALHRPPADGAFVYLLPGTPDNILRISSVSAIQERLGQKTKDAFYGTGFMYSTGDTICAARAGRVYDCSDAVKEGEKGNEVFRSIRNHINIQHKDGTLGRYEIRSPIKLLVAPEDNVIPGQPIAVFNRESERYEVMFSVNYLDEKKLLADNNTGTVVNPDYFISLPTLFCVGDNGQTNPLTVTNQTFKISHPKQLVGVELSKKEKKKIGLQ